jgi:hypothetical protein
MEIGRRQGTWQGREKLGAREDGIRDEPGTITLHRPVGERGLALIRGSGYAAMPGSGTLHFRTSQCRVDPRPLVV